MIKTLLTLFALLGWFLIPSYAWQQPLTPQGVEQMIDDHDHTHGHHHHHHHHGTRSAPQQSSDNGFDCGFDEMHARFFEQYPDRREKALKTERSWERAVQTGRFVKAAAGVHTVPVVVHLVHNSGSANITDADVRSAIQELNDAFANTGYYNPATGVDTEIQFCLAARDSLGNSTTGITRRVSPLSVLNHRTQDLALKNLVRWNPNNYINIWVVDEIIGGVAGYTYLPAAHGTAVDGIVLEGLFMNSGPAHTSVLVHEMGHYLGLYHTFQDGCNNTDCAAQGDRVCDTPPDNTTARSPCGVVINSCSSDEDDASPNNPFRAIALGGQGDQPDQIQNYMDYSNLVCYDRFSQGQADRMQFFLHGIRASLLRSSACLPACLSPIVVNFSASALTTTVGTPIAFTDNSTGNTTRQWSANGLSFGNTPTANYNFPSPGTYWVRIDASNGDPNCSQSDSILINVYCAPPCSEVCDNGIDDDGNGWIDCYDPACNCAPCSDNRANIWHFGDRTTFDFNSGAPTQPLTSQLISNETSATLCDANGNLLFYSNAEQVWNRNHVVMAGGASINSRQSLSQHLIIPHPGNPFLFYLFYNDDYRLSNGLQYSVIDLSTNNNLGSVTQLNVSLGTNQTIEHITALKQCNDRDYWLIVKEFQTNRYLVYPITSTGIGAPIVQNIGRVHVQVTSFGDNAAGCFAMHPRGNQIASVHRKLGIVELLDFDPSTGLLSNPREWAFPASQSLYGVEYSPSGELLYATDILSGRLIQYDLTLPTTAAIVSAAYTVAISGGIPYFGAVRQGPDGKIYCGRPNQSYISIIDDPDQRGAACNYRDQGLFFAGGRLARFGLPSPVRDLFTEPVLSTIVGPTAICSDTAVVQTYTIDQQTCNIDTVFWRHNGVNTVQGTAGSILRLNAANVGTDTLWATVVSPCTTKVVRHIVRTLIGGTIDLGPDTTVCQNGIVALSAGTGFQSYRWQDGSLDSMYTAFASGLYSVEAVTYCGDTLRDSIQITVSPLPAIAYPDTTINSGDTARYVLRGGGGYQHVWTPNVGLSCNRCPLPLFFPDSTTTYYHVYTNAAGCVGLDTVVVRVLRNCILSVRLDSLVEPCPGDPNGALYVSGIGGSGPFRFQWSTGDTTAALTGLAPSGPYYFVTVTDATGCVGLDSFLLGTASTPMLRVDTLSSPACGQATGGLRATAMGRSAPYRYNWSTGDTDSTLLNLAPGSYSVTATGANGCSSSLSGIELTDIPPLPVAFFPSTVDSCGRGTGVLRVIPMAPQIPFTYVWSTGDTGLVLRNLSAGVYTISVTTGACVSIETDTVFATPSEQVDLYFDPSGMDTTTVNIGDNFTVETSVNRPLSGGSYQWWVEVLRGSGIVFDTSGGLVPTIVGTASDTGAYRIQLVLTDRYGCAVGDSILLYVRPQAIFRGIPDAFTPNGDGVNDVFRPIGLPDGAIQFFRIYNRWGQVLFDSPGGNVGWDGNANGVEQPTEVYLYYLRYQLPGEPAVELRGSVTLLR